MAEARTFNFNEVAQPEEKDFQVANKMCSSKKGMTEAKPPVNDTGARNVGDPQTPNPASPQKTCSSRRTKNPGLSHTSD